MVNSADTSASMTAAQMADIVGRILARHGREVLEDRRRVLGLLRDHAPAETRAVRLLMSAYDLDVPKHLAAESGTPSQFKIEHEVNALVADTGLQADLARWAVEVWSAALSGSVPASVPTPAAIATGTAAVAAAPAAAAAVPVSPPAPAAPPPAAVVPAADDLTWGDDVSAAPAATPTAPVYVPPAPAPAYAPQYAQPQQQPPGYPPGAMAPVPVSQNPLVRYGVTGAVIVAAILGIKAYMDSKDYTAPPNDTPAQPAAPAQPARPATPTQPSVTIASTATDSAQWPVFSGASHPNNNAKAWQFQTNLRFADNRVFAYNVFVTLNADLSTGTGSMRAIDYRYLAADKADMVSSTPSLPVTRQYEASSKFYFTRLYSTSWAQNPSLAPNICMVFSSGNQAQSFAPESGIFCAFELQGGTCSSQSIGCGKFQ